MADGRKAKLKGHVSKACAGGEACGQVKELLTYAWGDAAVVGCDDGAVRVAAITRVAQLL